MMLNGCFTDIYYPNNEKLFNNASIDIIIYRYCKNKNLEKIIIYNDKKMYINNNNGIITFNKNKIIEFKTFNYYFNIYVGIVSGKENVLKNDEFGNIKIINNENKINNYILIDNFPTNNIQLNEYLIQHKKELINRKIRKFNEKNWYEFGALRNINIIKKNIDKDCIYINTLTRKNKIAFISKCNYFGGGLLMLLPKQNIDLKKIVNYLNSNDFKMNYTYSGRFKTGHRVLSNSLCNI